MKIIRAAVMRQVIVLVEIPREMSDGIVCAAANVCRSKHQVLFVVVAKNGKPVVTVRLAGTMITQ